LDDGEAHGGNGTLTFVSREAWAELALAVDGREHWELAAGTVFPPGNAEPHPLVVAYFRPDAPHDRWHGRVQLARMPDQRHHRFHVAIVHGITARFTLWASSAREAVRLAETHTRTQLSA
jgi:hypothetical protein